MLRFMFDHCLYFNASALARLLEREWGDAFKSFDLTPPQAFMLRVILQRPGLLQKEIAEALAISRPTATRLLDALEEKRLIERRASDNDGRETVIFPTDKASKIKQPLNDAAAAVTARIRKTLGAAEFAGAVEKIKSVRTVLG